MRSSDKKYVAFPGSILLLGFGSIGQAMMPLLFRHIDIPPSRVSMISAKPDFLRIADEYGVQLTVVQALTEGNYEILCSIRR